MKNVPRSRSEKSLALAGVRGNLGISDAARQMRRSYGPRGAAVRQDVLAATFRGWEFA